MQLRYRLFLWIGTLFLVAFVASFVLESRLTERKLVTARANLRADILELNEKKRQHLEEFIAIKIAAAQAELTALLQNISEYKQLVGNYAPTEVSLKEGTWFSAAGTLVANKWVDFIQNTEEDRVASLIIPSGKAMVPARHVQIDEELSWVLLEGEDPLIGVRFYVDPKSSLIPLLNFIPGSNPDVYVLFRLEEVPAFLEAWKGVKEYPYLASFVDAVKRIEGHLQKLPPQMEGRRRAIEEKFAAIPPSPSPEDPLVCVPDIAPQLEEEIKRLLVKIDEIFLTWRMTGLMTEGPFAPSAPYAIARFPKNQNRGEGLVGRSIFHQEPLFDARDYFLAHAPTVSCWHPAESIAMIKPPSLPTMFLGNTLEIAYKERFGYLTLGRNVDENLLELALSLHQAAFLVHNNEIVSAFTQEGSKMEPAPLLPLKQMLHKKSGIIEWNGERYFFLHMIPYPFLDLHFFVIDLESKEFAFINELDAGAKRLVASLSFDMRLVAVGALLLVLALLHRLANRISHPISQLARAAETIGEGHLEEVVLPEPSGGKRDEVSILCHSFELMVMGLREKEKVKGVLNKVVSQEIAQEILKGHVHLGGEEKLATVLFGDIRNFSKMTSKMAPAEVIEILNSCMTKIAKLVDEHGGVIDKFVGDEVMALYGAPLEKPDSALEAVVSGLGMMEVLRAWNTERRAQGLPEVEMGVGIHTGVVLAGNMGAENRLNYTVLGSNVNLASRICGAAEGGEVLISHSTYEAPGVKERIQVEELPPASFKGFEEKVQIYRATGIKP